jgi:hypothetical protein
MVLAVCLSAASPVAAHQVGRQPSGERHRAQQRRSAGGRDVRRSAANAGASQSYRSTPGFGTGSQYRVVEGRAPLPAGPNGARQNPGGLLLLPSDDPLALQLLQRSFRPTLPYVGNQRTEVAGNVSEQRIEGDEKGRMRLEYRTPAAFAGDVMIVAPNSFYDYHARAGRTDLAFWPVGRDEKERTLVQRIRRGVLTIARTGSEQIAGRDCAIVTVASPRPNSADPVTQRKLWIDTQTGIVMRREAWNAHGQISASYFTSITIGPEAGVSPEDFLPRSLPRSAINEPLFPKGQPEFQTVEQARSSTPFPILQPSELPEGYTLDGVWVFPNGARGINTSVLLRYSRGVNHFSLFEHRVVNPHLPLKPFVPRRNPGSIIRWQTLVAPGDAIDLIYIGHLSPEEALALQSSVR